MGNNRVGTHGEGLRLSLDGEDRYYSTPVVAGGRVFAATVEGKVVAADEETGEKLWEWKGEAEIRASPSIVNSTLFIGDIEGRLHALDAVTGEHLWQFQTGHRISATPGGVQRAALPGIVGRKPLRHRVVAAWILS